jgi:hypothetical protein
VATIDGHSILLDRQQANYYVCYNGWIVATTATYYAALGKIAQCQEELKSLAPWIRAMEAAQ